MRDGPGLKRPKRDTHVFLLNNLSTIQRVLAQTADIHIHMRTL